MMMKGSLRLPQVLLVALLFGFVAGSRENVIKNIDLNIMHNHHHHDGSSDDSLELNSFPTDFVFGTASASYQYEGAAAEDGRGPSIWDTFTQKYPDKIKDHSSGAVADDSYHRYKEDVDIMKDLGFKAYRFSISWSRLLPSGDLKGGVNAKGLQYYNNLIDELISNGIQPFVTLFHWDLPQALEDKYGGFLNPQIVDDFTDYVELCFRSFGDRVKHWLTLNEPLTYVSDGYVSGRFAPGRCSKWYNSNCTGGDSATEPYIVAHNMLLSHAAAVQLYKNKYQMSQGGQIGIVLCTSWFVPLDQSSANTNAAYRGLAFSFDWFMEPLKSGVYPIEMVKMVQKRLPVFTEEQSSMVKGSFDFIGVNYYSSSYAFNVPCDWRTDHLISYATDPCVSYTDKRNGIPIGPKGASDWLNVYPNGLLQLLLYTKFKFNDPVIYITENGIDEFNTGSISLNDDYRIDYYTHHLSSVKKAIMSGVRVKGFFAWSLLDNFEWADGYTVRFGIVYVDYKDGLKRYLKKSALWFKEFLHQHNYFASH